MRHGDAAAVIGERDVLVALRLRSLGHRFDGRRAVGPVGMDVKVPAKVRARHQTRQLVRRRERDLAAVLAQFGRNERQSELFVDFLLG